MGADELGNDVEGGGPRATGSTRHTMYTDTENTGVPMVPDSTRRKPDNRNDQRQYYEEIVLSHCLPE